MFCHLSKSLSRRWISSILSVTSFAHNNTVSLTGHKDGWYNGEENEQNRTIVTTRVCAPVPPGSTGALALVPLLWESRLWYYNKERIKENLSAGAVHRLSVGG